MTDAGGDRPKHRQAGRQRARRGAARTARVAGRSPSGSRVCSGCSRCSSRRSSSPRAGTASSCSSATDNLANIVRAVSEIGIIAVGMTFVILIGGIDLSVGAVLGLAAVGSSPY